MDILTDLIVLEKVIEEHFLYLVYLERNHENNSFEYVSMIEKIRSLLKQEQHLLEQASDYLVLRDFLQPYLAKPLRLINLSYNNHTFLYRLNYLLESFCCDEGVEYASFLTYDIHKIILKFLEQLINNPYYRDVRDDLIRYKYDIIFLDYHIESDYMSQDKISEELNSEFLKKDLISSKYIDQVLLIDQIREEMVCLKNITDINNSKDHVFVIILAIAVLARLALCDEKMLAFIIDDFNNMLVCDELDIEVKDIVLEMIDLFKQIRNCFYFSR